MLAMADIRVLHKPRMIYFIINSLVSVLCRLPTRLLTIMPWPVTAAFALHLQGYVTLARICNHPPLRRTTRSSVVRRQLHVAAAWRRKLGRQTTTPIAHVHRYGFIAGRTVQPYALLGARALLRYNQLTLVYPDPKSQPYHSRRLRE
jgi:hypothetical protein